MIGKKCPRLRKWVMMTKRLWLFCVMGKRFYVYLNRKFLYIDILYSLEFDLKNLFICSCDGEYFLDDLGLKAIPTGDWFCASCTKSQSSNVDMSIKKTKKTRSNSNTLDVTSPIITASTRKEALKSITSSRKRTIDTVLVDPSPVEGRRSTRNH
jgi:hypothetical protein